MNSNIKAILFDSGRVLNKPATGHWFITPNFFKYVDKKKFNSLPKKKRNSAFLKAGKYISSQKLIKTEEDEFRHFFEYYKILFNSLPELDLDDNKIESVTKDLVFNYDKYSFFDDVIAVIPNLSKIYKLAVVSDAWPSLENVFKKVGLRTYFSSFIISSQVGVSKPHELMYKTALLELDVSPAEAIFVDDNINNCDGAKKLGVKTILLCRDYGMYLINRITCRKHKVVRDIRYLQDMDL